MTRLDIDRLELRAFAHEVDAYTARSLDLLRAIESTLAWLGNLTAVLRAHAEFAEYANDALSGATALIDPDGGLSDILETGQNQVERIYNLLITKRESARNDDRLSHDDGIEDAYTEAIATASSLHNAINSLRWNLGEHDIDCAPHRVSEENLISDPSELRASLMSLRG